MSDDQGTALSSHALPTAAPDLSQFENHFEILIFFGFGAAIVSVNLDTLVDGVLPGFEQSNPILPIAGNGSVESPWKFFVNSRTGTVTRMPIWFDPPLAAGFMYETQTGSLFTSIVDFPTGFADPFTVSVDGTVLGSFLPGESVDFSTFPGGGVSAVEFVGLGTLRSSFGNELGDVLAGCRNRTTNEQSAKGARHAVVQE